MQGTVIVEGAATPVIEEPVFGEADTIKPIISTPSSISAQTTNPAGRIVTFSNPVATDNVGISGGIACTPQSGSFFPVGITTVTCTASDAAGNTSYTSFLVSVTQTGSDTEPPSISTLNDVTVSIADGVEIAVAYQNPIATDNVGVTIGPICTPQSGSVFPVGSSIVVCMASDSAGNTET